MNRVLVAACAALAVLAAGCTSSRVAAGPGPSDLVGQTEVGNFHGAGLVPPQPRPAFTLTDTAGRPFAFGTATAGRPTLLFFGYTHCDAECPATMADVRLALRDIPVSVAERTDVVFVTTDVKRDSRRAIKHWLAQFSIGTKASWIGLRGTQDEIDAAQAAAHIPIAEDGGETHSAEVLLYGPDDYAHVAFLLGSNEGKQMAHDLPIVAGEGS
jgi:protein SCO1/2